MTSISSRFSLRRWLGIVGLLALTVAGLACWFLLQRTHRIRQGIPPRPDLAQATANLTDEINSAETSAFAWGGRSDALVRLGGLYHANGFFAEALVCYRTLSELEPRDARWPHLIASIEASFGRIADAIPWQRRASELAPSDFMVHLRLGDLLLKHNAIADAIGAYARAREIDPASPYVLLGLARCDLRRDDWPAAQTRLREAVRIQPGFAAGWALLAGVESKLGNEPAATEARRRGNAQFREITDPWLSFLPELCYDPYQLSVMAAAAPNPAQARTLVDRAIALAPAVAAYRRQLAKILIAARDLAAARKELEHAVVLAPDDAEAWSALVDLLIDMQDGRAAMTALAEGLKHCPQSGFLHFTNGRRLAATGRFAEAERALKLSQRLQPTEIRAYVELSALYVRTNRLTAALTEATAALAVDPANPTVLGMLAQLSIMQGDESATLLWVRQLRALASDESATLRQIEAMFQQQFSRPLPS
jgi:tetratricopeptide (TPR) repeat protein